MKNKIIKTLTVGLGCLMLALPINHNSNFVVSSHSNVIQPMEEHSLYGMVQSKNIIHIDQDMPSL